MINSITRLFPLWAITLSVIAWLFPQPFIELKPAIMPLLALIMLCMGLTLHFRDFTRVFATPRLIVLGVILQYSVMPAAAFVIAHALGLGAMLTAGMILVGASPGGTASNVICYLARANVALSITLTSLSTLLAIVLTPWLSWLYIDTSIHVPALEMLKTILLLVIAPVTLGVLINEYLHRFIRPISQSLPLVAVIAIVTIIGIVVGLNHERIGNLSLMLLLAVALHNAAGLLIGYLVTRLLGHSEQEARTLAIETGMQNSGLAVALAVKYFAPAAALAGAIFSVWHNISGSLLASFWRRHNSQ